MAKIIDIIQTFNVRIALKNIYSKIDEIIRKVNESPEPTYKVYSALLAQSGENAPTATVLENTLGGDVVWSRIDSGYYKATLNNAFFNKDKVFILNSPSSFINQSITVQQYWSDENSIELSTLVYSFYGGALSAQDGILIDGFFPIEIRVYN